MEAGESEAYVGLETLLELGMLSQALGEELGAPSCQSCTYKLVVSLFHTIPSLGISITNLPRTRALSYLFWFLSQPQPGKSRPMTLAF